MASIAIFATEKPIPGQTYTGIPITGKQIFLRFVDVSEGEGADSICDADAATLPGETLLNTYETDE